MDKEKDWIARKTATVGQVTLVGTLPPDKPDSEGAVSRSLRHPGPSKAPAVFGRGTDFYCSLPKLCAKSTIGIDEPVFPAVCIFSEHLHRVEIARPRLR